MSRRRLTRPPAKPELLLTRDGRAVPEVNTHQGLLKFLYQAPLGRLLLRGLIQPRVSAWYGRYLQSQHSKRRIAPFVARYQVSLADATQQEFASFDAFFTRRLKAAARPVDPNPKHLVAPCDGRLSVVPIEAATIFMVKGQPYPLNRLVQGAASLDDFAGGVAVMIRLAETDYHHYAWIDSGTVTASRAVPGVLHTIRPIALAQRPVFIENQRVWTDLATTHFGRVIQMEVGALTVGTIHNQPGPPVRGAEKGYFSYGGSTVILLFTPGRLQLDADLWARRNRFETLIRRGERIGQAIDILKGHPHHD